MSFTLLIICTNIPISPVQNIIPGNLEGVRAPDEQDRSWKAVKQEVHAVETRSQKSKKNRTYKPLKVADGVDNLSSYDMKREQQSDDSLDRVRILVRPKQVKQRQDGGTSRFLAQSGLIFREFQSPTVANG